VSTETPRRMERAVAPGIESEWRPSSLRMESAHPPNCTSHASISQQPRNLASAQRTHYQCLANLRPEPPQAPNLASAIVAVRTGQPLPTFVILSFVENPRGWPALTNPKGPVDTTDADDRT
jgi:hypothetical protein